MRRGLGWVVLLCVALSLPTAVPAVVTGEASFMTLVILLVMALIALWSVYKRL